MPDLAIGDRMGKNECEAAALEQMFFLHDPDNDAALPEKVYIEATSRCNLHCSICFRHGWYDETPRHMDFGIARKLAAELEDMSSVAEVFFGGMGEPLFHPQIVEMVGAMPGRLRKSLLTNGTLLTEELAKRLLDAGLTQLWVSMDGFDEKSYEAIQLGSRFAQICENLRAFNRARAGSKTRLGITFVVTPENVGQLARINEFADEMGADELNVSHMIPGAPVAKEDSLYEREDIPVGRMRRFAPAAGPTQEHVCPFISGNHVFVRADGAVAPCMQLLHSGYTYLDEEKRKIKSFTYGNIETDRPTECWNREDYRAFRHRVNTFYFPFCRVCWGCDDRKENLADCILNDAPTCGACLWASGKVFCP